MAHVLVLFTCIPIHECAHGWVAYKLGDHTAKDQGRLTLNPLKHFDPMGAIALLLLGFGWAKPVPVDPRNFRGNRKTGMALTALAGPVANVLLALVLILLYKILYLVLGLSGVVQSLAWYAVLQVLLSMVLTNISLAVFNMIPINPLDGSRILGFVLPDRLYFGLMRYERYIYLVLLVALVMGFLSGPIQRASRAVLVFLDSITSFVDVIANLLM